MSLADVDWSVFRVSALVSVTATLFCVAAGTPLAWLIARSGRRVSVVLSSVALVPLVLPPTAVGYYVLYGVGRQSAFGRFLIDDLGLRLVFTWEGAAVAAAIVALPLYVRTAQAGFEQIEPEVLAVAETMASPWRLFFRVAVPLAWPGLAAAVLLSLARSLGEFGATVIVAANIPGETRTLPAAIYDAVQAGNEDLANTLALLSVAVGLCILAALALLLDLGRRR